MAAALDRRSEDPGRSSDRAETTAVFVAAVALILALQITSGAHQAELTGYPDEPTHAVSGVMVGEYLRQGAPWSPVDFASNYYVHYPKIGIGHWPPFFYLLIGLWTLAFSTQASSLLVLVAVIAAVATTALYRLARSELDWTSSLIVAFAWAMLPMVRWSSAMVMPDILVTALCLLAANTYCRYLSAPAARSACVFGLLAAFALLTRGDAVVLALMPPLAVLATQRFELLRRRDFWYPVPIVLLLAGPWYAAAGTLFPTPYGSTVRRAFGLERQANSTLPRILSYSNELGWILTAICVAGLIAWGLKRGTRSPAWAVAVALTVGLLICRLTLDEHAERRYLMPGVAGLMLGLPFLLSIASRWLGSPSTRRLLAPALMLLALLQPEGPTWLRAVAKQNWGLGEIAKSIAARSDATNSIVLVAGNVEGPLIAEAAMLEPRPRTVYLRGTRTIGLVTWNGKDNGVRFDSTTQIDQYLQQLAVGDVILDAGGKQSKAQYQRMLREIVGQDAAWKLVAGNERVLWFSRVGPLPERQRPVEIDMTWRLGRKLKLDEDAPD